MTIFDEGSTPRTFREVAIVIHEIRKDLDEVRQKQNWIFNLLVTTIFGIIATVLTALMTKGII